MNLFFNVYNKIFGKVQSNKNESLDSDEEINNEESGFSDTLFNKSDFIDIKDYLKEIKAIYTNILDYLENKQNDDEIQNENFNFSDQEIFKDKYIFKIFINLLAKIADNHKRSSRLIHEIENILKSAKDEIQNYFTNDKIFNIFQKNKKLLLFLFKEQIIIPDKLIFSIINNPKNKTKYNNYPLYFYPEFKSFFTKELIIEYKIDEINFEKFEEQREIGENDSYLSQLIRDDSIDEFIIYVNQNNLSLKNQINSSIFETNDFLINETPTYLQYATFFGSIQIFQYIRLNNIELDSSLWLYAIHGKNPEIIHLLEENQVVPDSHELEQILLESIKCHHNEIKMYLQDVYNNLITDFDSSILKQSIKYYNFDELSEDLLTQSEIFYYLCKYDYCQIVYFLLMNKKNKIDINWQIEKKIRNKRDGYELMFSDSDRYNFEKRYQEKKTPLISAIEKGNKEIVEILLNQTNIDINIKFQSSFAIYLNEEYTCISGKDNKSILFIAAEKGYSEIVKLLLKQKGININEVNETNNGQYAKKLTALHISIANEHIETTKILLNNKNIDTNSIEKGTYSYQNHYGKTPLYIAIEKNNVNLVQLLLENPKTDPNKTYYCYDHCHMCDVKDHDIPLETLSPLHLAIEKNNKEIIQLLLNKKNIKINEIAFKRSPDSGRTYDKSYETALHIAVKNNYLDIVQMLLSYDGINVNSIAKYKKKSEKDIQYYVCYDKITEEKTALLIAIQNGNLDIIQNLLKNKKINKKIKLIITSKVYSNDLKKHNKVEKLSAIDIANKKGNTDIINILK